MSTAKKPLAVHRRYHDRKDLAHLARCENINGPICGPERLTSDDAAVTCKRCLRIMSGTAVPRGPSSEADRRLNSRLLADPKRIHGREHPRPFRSNRSAWAGIHRVLDWCLQLAKDDEVPVQINVQAEEMAEILRDSIAWTGGGKA